MSETSPLNFDGRVAVITGAGRGLGRAYAELLASRGARVVVNDCDADPADAVVDEITAAGGQAVASIASVATAEGGQAIIDAALQAYGRLDIVIHNAGNVRRGSLRELSHADFEAVLDVHLRGAFHVVRPAFPVLCDAGYGRIVLTSSIGGIYGNHGVANYAAAKAGLIGFSKAVAREVASRGITVNVVAPGLIDTEILDEQVPVEEILKMVPAARMGTPEEVAGAVNFLMSEEAAYITRQVLAVNGGLC